jgi:flagellar biosynthesis protein FliP
MNASAVSSFTRRRAWCVVAATAVALLLAPAAASAQAPQNLNLKVDGVGAVSAPLQIVVLLTLLTFVPAALVMMT